MDKTFTISKRGILFFMALLGFVLTIVLAVIYFNANYNPAAGASFCTSQDNPIINCDGVAKSADAQFLGIPLAYWGMLFYVIVMVLLLADKLKNIKCLQWLEVFKNPLSYISILGLFSFFISMVLAFISIVSLKMVCILCVITYALNFFIGITASDIANETFSVAMKKSIDDFVEALKIKKYRVSFAVVTVLALIFLTITGTTYVLTPQIKDIKVMDELYNMQTNEYANAANGNFLGDENAKVVVYTYSDFMCPYCVIENRLMHKVVKDLKNVRVEFVNYPLDKDCNKNIPSEFHKGACDMAKLAIAAKKQNRFWDMANILFESKGATQEELLSVAKSEGFNVKQLQSDITSATVRKQLLDDIDTSTEIQVGGTPAFSVKGKLYMGLKPYNEIKELLIDAGAEKR